MYQRKEHLAKAMLDHVIEKRIHTVIKAGFLEKKGGDLEIHATAGVGDPPQYHAVKHRNISKGNSRAWRKRWFVLFDDGILQWYASGPPAAAEEDSSAFARSSVRRNNLSSVFLSFGPSLSRQINACSRSMETQQRKKTPRVSFSVVRAHRFPGGLWRGLSQRRPSRCQARWTYAYLLRRIHPSIRHPNPTNCPCIWIYF